MIAKIGRSSNLFGTLSYNNSKIEKDKGEILMTYKMIESADGKYSVAQLARSFEPYLLANRKTEKHALHISLNPDPKDQVSDEQYKEMAQLYMNEMGFVGQPFVVFKHNDIDRSHIHIVSVCVDEDGRKISDQFEKIRSMKVCRELENKFGLISAVGKQSQQNKKIFRPINYKSGDIKSQIASVIRHLPSHYQFQSLGEYNALLSLYNMTAEKVEGELHGQLKRGLLYFPLDGQGKKSGNPFKSSLFGKNAGFQALEMHFAKSKAALKNHPIQKTLQSAVTIALHSTNNQLDFQKQLAEQGIHTVVLRNDTGRIYGITFIDHNSKSVWKGSSLGKELSANTFNDYWHNIKQETKESVHSKINVSPSNDKEDMPTEKPHHYFDFISSEKYEDGLIETFGGLFRSAQGEDYEEQDFANKMKKKRINKKR